ncbi:MAG: AraC family transcriptional regulator [Alphaproteobacteria bacterium]
MSLQALPQKALPEWGRRVSFDRFFVELVPAGPRTMNIQLAESIATISFSADEGASTLAGDRLRRYDRRPYEFIVAPEGFPLRGESTAAPEVLVLVFAFEALRKDIAAALQISPEILTPRVIIGGPRSFTTEIAQRIRRHMLVDAISEHYLHSLSLTLIVEMLRLPKRQQQNRRGSTLNERVLRSILDYIDANLDANLSLEGLAGLAGVVTHQFGRSFKRKVGQPPHRYVLARRIEAARQRLKTTDDPIAEIAYATGFSSQSHMTTTFRREIGITPASIRNEAKA